MSVALRHPVLPQQLETEEVQVHQRTQIELTDEKEDGILGKRNEKRNSQPAPTGWFDLVALLFVPAWIPRILSFWGWWQGVDYICSTTLHTYPLLGVGHHFGWLHEALPSLQHPDQPHCRLRTSQKALQTGVYLAENSSWVLDLIWVLMTLGLQTVHLLSCAVVGVKEMVAKPGTKIIKLVHSSFQPWVHYGCSFDLLRKELGTTFSPLSWSWTSLALLQIKNNSGIELKNNKKRLHSASPVCEHPEWKLWLFQIVLMVVSQQCNFNDFSRVAADRCPHEESEAEEITLLQGSSAADRNKRYFFPNLSYLSRLWNIFPLPWQNWICCLWKASEIFLPLLVRICCFLKSED